MTNLESVKVLANSAVLADTEGKLYEAIGLYRRAVMALQELIGREDNRTLRLSMMSRTQEYTDRSNAIESILNTTAASEIYAQALTVDREGKYAEAMHLYAMAAKLFTQGAICLPEHQQSVLRAQASSCAARSAEIIELGLLTPTSGETQSAAESTNVVAALASESLFSKEMLQARKEDDDALMAAVENMHIEVREEPDVFQELPHTPVGKITGNSGGSIALLSEYILHADDVLKKQRQNLHPDTTMTTATAIKTDREACVVPAPTHASSSSWKVTLQAPIAAPRAEDLVYLRRIIAVQEEIENQQAAEMQRLRGLVSQQRKTIQVLAATVQSVRTPTAVPAAVVAAKDKTILASDDTSPALSVSLPGSGANAELQAFLMRKQEQLQHQMAATAATQDPSTVQATLGSPRHCKTTSSGCSERNEKRKVTHRKVHRPITRSMTGALASKFSRVTAPVFGSPVTGPVSPSASSKSATAKASRSDNQKNCNPAVRQAMSTTASSSRGSTTVSSMPIRRAKDPYRVSHRNSTSPIPVRHYSPTFKNPERFVRYVSKTGSTIPDIFQNDTLFGIFSGMQEAHNTGATAFDSDIRHSRAVKKMGSGSNHKQTSATARSGASPLPAHRASAINMSMTPPGKRNATRARRLEERRIQLEQEQQELCLHSDSKSGVVTRGCRVCARQVLENFPPTPIPSVPTGVAAPATNCIAPTNAIARLEKNHEPSLQKSRASRSGDSAEYFLAVEPAAAAAKVPAGLTRAGSFSPYGFFVEGSTGNSRTTSPAFSAPLNFPPNRKEVSEVGHRAREESTASTRTSGEEAVQMHAHHELHNVKQAPEAEPERMASSAKRWKSPKRQSQYGSYEVLDSAAASAHWSSDLRDQSKLLEDIEHALRR